MRRDCFAIVVNGATDLELLVKQTLLIAEQRLDGDIGSVDLRVLTKPISYTRSIRKCIRPQLY